MREDGGEYTDLPSHRQYLSSQAGILRYVHFPLFIVRYSFVIVRNAPSPNDK
jgi:hypothetical protein